jgi:hypothetical protein
MTTNGREAMDERIERDPELETALEALDPGGDDGLYWARFRRSVLLRAGAELARRRDRLDPTVGDVVVSWGRAVVPLAVVAAGLAAVLLWEAPAAPDPGAAGVEELLAEGLEDGSPPAFLASEPDEMGVMMASDPSF